MYLCRLVLLVLLVCAKSFRKKNKEFKTALITSFILLLVYFDNLFNSPILIEKLFDKNIHAIGTVHKNRKLMSKMPEDKEMKRGDCEFLYSKNVMTCKWMDNRSVLRVSTAPEGIDDVSLVQRRKRICDKICYSLSYHSKAMQQWHGWD